MPYSSLAPEKIVRLLLRRRRCHDREAIRTASSGTLHRGLGARRRVSRPGCCEPDASTCCCWIWVCHGKGGLQVLQALRARQQGPSGAHHQGARCGFRPVQTGCRRRRLPRSTSISMSSPAHPGAAAPQIRPPEPQIEHSGSVEPATHRSEARRTDVPLSPRESRSCSSSWSARDRSCRAAR